MNTTTVTTPNELEIRVERIFDAPRAHVFSVWTEPKLIPEWWGDGTVVEEMDVRPGGTSDDALCYDRGARHDDAVRGRGRSEGRLRARRRAAAAANGDTMSMATRTDT
jgi:hypothetical protein